MSESYLRALIYSHISSFVIYDYQKGGKFKQISCFSHLLQFHRTSLKNHHLFFNQILMQNSK